MGEEYVTSDSSINILTGRIAIVKIIAWFDNWNSIITTGAVINESTIVTAGHSIVCEHGHAIAMQVVAGQGRTTESRLGARAIVHGRWYALRATSNDLGFISWKAPLTR